MEMEIKINASDMLKVLVNFGLDATESKALIFDLLNYPNGQLPERRKLKDAKKQRMKKRVEVSEDEYEEDEEDSEDDDEDTEEEEEDEESLTKIRRPKKISFKTFGGPAQTIQPSKKV
jgi:TATA-binding protein-associated factor Taf7